MQNQTIPYQDGLDFGVGVDLATGGRRQYGATGTPQKMQAGLTGGDGTYMYVRIDDTHDLETHLGISAEASGGAGLFSASARFSFAKDVKVQSNSTTILLKCTKSFGFKQILKPDLDPSAAPLVANGQADLFTQRYGDYFVAGIESGGQFFGVIKIDVASETDNTKISAALSGSYGMFSAKVSTDLSEAVKDTHSRVSATLYYQGGNVSRDVRTPDDLFAARDEWDKTVLTDAKPFAVLLLPWVIANGPNPPNSADMQKQQDVLTACAKLRSQIIDRLNLLEYMMDPLHTGQFEMKSGDADRLSKYHAAVSFDADLVQQAASFAIDNAKQAVEPETYARTIKGLPTYAITVFARSDLPPRAAGEQDTLAAKGEAIARQDPLSTELRNRQPAGPCRHGFDVGMAAAEGQTAPGPGKQSIHDSLDPAGGIGFTSAVDFSLERNRNEDFAARGAAIVKADPVVAKARSAVDSVMYWLGFDIGAGLFGDPSLGGAGHTSEGPGSQAIRDALCSDGQKGFRAAVDLYLVQKHKLSQA
jgi:hypothetical protein